MQKRIMTVDDLVKFCEEQNFAKFNADESGYKLCVQVPSVYESDDEKSSDQILYGRVKLLHTGRNRNGSNVTKEAAEKCMSTIKYKPLLANFCEIDGVRDFTSHDFEINEDGSISYIEHQIGCFTAEEPTLEYEEEKDRYYIYANVAIPRGYTDAADIIERKNGTKVSAELYINSMSYDAEKKELVFDDIEVSGCTCLGVDPETGRAINEGMEGAKLSIEDFSKKEENVQTKDELIEALDRLNKQIEEFNIKESEKGGNTEMNKFEELLAKYGVTAEQVTFDYEGVSDEQLETLFEEAFGDDKNEPETYSVSFELSHEDVRRSLYELLSAQDSNDWFYITEVYDDHFVYQSWNTNEYYGQKYSKDETNVSFDGERYQLFAMMLTEDEKAKVEEMRANYDTLKSDLDKANETLDKYESEPDKIDILNSSDYELVSGTAEFEELSKRENYFNLSVDEVKAKADEILLNYAKTQKFSKKESGEGVSSKKLPKIEKKQSRYGNIFSK